MHDFRRQTWFQLFWIQNLKTPMSLCLNIFHDIFHEILQTWIWIWSLSWKKAKLDDIRHKIMKNHEWVPRRVCIWIHTVNSYMIMKNHEFTHEFMKKTCEFGGARRVCVWIHIHGFIYEFIFLYMNSCMNSYMKKKLVIHTRIHMRISA